MAMFPNATRGLMPFVGQSTAQKRPHSATFTCKRGKGKPQRSILGDKKLKAGKLYQVTLRDRTGRSYTYIVKSDGTKSLPELCATTILNNGLSASHARSTPNVNSNVGNASRYATRRPLGDTNGLGSNEDTKSLDAKKEGLFSSIIRFLRQKTGKSKTKRKTRAIMPGKRRRTVSAMSNLDPIQESPDEYEEYVTDDDSDSYSSSLTDLDNSENVSVISVEANQVETVES